MRWDFPDRFDLDEAAARDAITRAMDRWWEAFVANKQKLEAAFSSGGRSEEVAEFTNAHLNPIVEGLCWEYGPGIEKNGHRLVITPEGNVHLAPLVRELLRRAPELPDWEFYPGRVPEKPEWAFRVAEQIARFKAASDVRVRASLGRYGRVDLEFHIPNSRSNEDGAFNWTVRAVEQLLGADTLDHWIGNVAVARPQSIVKRLLNGKPAGLVSPERLKPTVDALIAASREQLPDPPPRALAQLNFDDASWTTFELEPAEGGGAGGGGGGDDYPQRDDLFFVATCEPELLKATVDDRLFHSARFSRTGETFAYLKLDRRGNEARGILPIDSADARGAIEEAVNATLGEHNLGCTTGGGTGVMYAYIDMALTDVRRAISVLRELLQRRRVNERSWVLFFDPELADEWMGVYPQTPPPPARAPQQ